MKLWASRDADALVRTTRITAIHRLLRISRTSRALRRRHGVRRARGASGCHTDGMIEPDSKDWTWVISQKCPECGFDGSAVSHTEVANRILADAKQWPRRLAAVEATLRPRPTVWSALE